MDESWIKYGVMLLGIVLGVTYKKLVMSRTEIKNTKIVERDFLLRLMQSEEETKFSKANKMTINHLKQEVYSSILGFHTPLRTVNVLLNTDDSIDAISIFKKYRLALTHQDGKDYISFRKGGVTRAWVSLFAFSIFLLIMSFMVFVIGDYYLQKEGDRVFNLFAGGFYKVGGIGIAIAAGALLGKMLDFIGSRKTIERGLKGIFKNENPAKE